MFGKALTSLARPAVRSSAALNGPVASQRLFQSSAVQAMKAAQPKSAGPTSLKDTYAQSRALNLATIARVKSAFPSAPNAAFTSKSLQTGMPQLVPFFWVGEVFFGFGTFTIMLYFMTKYFLPNTVRRFMARTFISKL